METKTEKQDTRPGSRGALRSRLDDLKTLRDEVRVKVHLAGMDAKDLLAEMEPQIDRLEHELEAAADDALEVTAKSLEKVATSLRKLRAHAERS